ncbi:hypothetical protein [Microbacterium ulmi]|uniref:Uncharacterized protein n=1 Tax=Microbacterium ulmi TaxID=179095 RepID=A0A7Y2M0L0_9MICO|nr:hypothetical protein [Microbacterium ulmi]NII69381.1 hypothetical protein [Microbacterium ulmi]NNH04007.1 hypothetical protein [Microbacterium ulmi]
METAAKPMPRLGRLALLGVSLAIAWLAVSVVLGWGFAQASADDRDQQTGAVASLLDSVGAAATGLLGDVVSDVPEIIELPATPAPAAAPAPPAPAPAPAPARPSGPAPAPAPVPSAHDIVTTVAPVTAPALDLVPSDAVTAVAGDLVDLAESVPVVGQIVAETGLDDLVEDAGDLIDTALSAITPADGASPVPDSPAGTVPGSTLPAAPQPGVLADPAAAAAVPLVHRVVLPVHTPSVGHGIPPAVGEAHLAGGGDPRSPDSPLTGGLCPSTVASGPGGAGPGAWTLAALDPHDAHRAWVRHAGPEDEHAPPAPTSSTDVSPD